MTRTAQMLALAMPIRTGFSCGLVDESVQSKISEVETAALAIRDLYCPSDDLKVSRAAACQNMQKKSGEQRPHEEFRGEWNYLQLRCGLPPIWRLSHTGTVMVPV